MMRPGEGLEILIIGLAVLIVLFLIMREVVLWYFRINETVNYLKSIDASLLEISGRSTDAIEVIAEPSHLTKNSTERSAICAPNGVSTFTYAPPHSIRLYEAIMAGGMSNIEGAIDDGADVNFPVEFEEGIDIGSMTKRCFRPIETAIAFGSADAVRLLVHRGAVVQRSSNPDHSDDVAWAKSIGKRYRAMLLESLQLREI